MSVGFVNLGLSILIYNLMMRALRASVPEANLRIVCSNAVAFAITLTTAFFLNARITFRKRHADFSAYCRYGVVNLIGFGLNTLLVLGFSHAIAVLRHETVAHMVDHFLLGKNLAYLSAVGCVFFWNFFMSRHWVFRHPSVDTAPTLLQRPNGAANGYSDGGAS